MSRVRVYLYSSCSSCRNAEQVLKSAGLDYERRDLFSERLSTDELHELFQEIGKQPAEVLSKRSIPYRQLQLADKTPSDESLMAMMAEHPGLLRRPIVIAPDEGRIAFNRTALESLARRHSQE
jgi:regulatory protein spx